MKEFNFYIDDSGTRNPDRKPGKSHFGGDWFALGGVVVASEHEGDARDLHGSFCEAWKIDYPLHSVKIRHRSDNFAWVGALDEREQKRFFAELDELMRTVPVFALACVIDRPGYNARYAEKYGKDRWSLCKTAFPIIAERAVKFAMLHAARVRLYVERSDKASEPLLRSHYESLRADGMPFANGGDAKYQPLTGDVMRERLYDLKFKNKTSPMLQLADLMLYPLCKGKYQPDYRPMDMLKREGKLIEAILPAELTGTVGTKYSCFDR
jgi:hypothetical protein